MASRSCRDMPRYPRESGVGSSPDFDRRTHTRPDVHESVPGKADRDLRPVAGYLAPVNAGGFDTVIRRRPKWRSSSEKRSNERKPERSSRRRKDFRVIEDALKMHGSGLLNDFVMRERQETISKRRNSWTHTRVGADVTQNRQILVHVASSS